jgi:hypothetical protein
MTEKMGMIVWKDVLAPAASGALTTGTLANQKGPTPLMKRRLQAAEVYRERYSSQPVAGYAMGRARHTVIGS